MMLLLHLQSNDPIHFGFHCTRLELLLVVKTTYKKELQGHNDKVHYL